MRPDRMEVSWDAEKSKWLIRIETGEEVIRGGWPMLRHYSSVARSRSRCALSHSFPGDFRN